MDGVESLIHRRGTLTAALRLLCLASLTAGGLPPKRLDAFRRDVLQAYGSRHLFTLKNLSAAGLLERRDAGAPRPWFPAARKSLKLVVDGLSESAPDDIAYTYSHSGCAATPPHPTPAAATQRGFLSIQRLVF